MKTVIAALCGLPGSGKTRFISDFISTKPGFNILHISYDAIIARDSNLDEEDWKHRRKSIRQSVESYLRGSLTTAPWLNEDNFIDGASRIVFIDDNNFLSSMRYEYYQLCRSLEIGFCQIELRVSPELSIYRNKELRSSTESISPDIIRKMASKFESPDPLKNPWEVYSFQIDNRGAPQQNFDMIHSILNTALENPVKDHLTERSEAAEASRSACSASVVHQADVLLRKKISAIIKELKESKYTKEERNVKIDALICKKKEVLEDLKTGHARVPSDIVRLMGSKEKKDWVIQELSEGLDRLLNLS
uniref:L-seryl-tRNASec kinase n=1 Tax=Caligus clemensi TaxID=344056 RepID=C1C2V9_CALCM|nr:L-seryl-tRNASec kinase [Caligus clemensi]